MEVDEEPGRITTGKSNKHIFGKSNLEDKRITFL